MSKTSFTMRLSEEERELFKKQASQERRSRTGQFLWLIKRRQEELDSGDAD